MKRIMFVCHGNICRSPMAEFIFKDMLERQGKSALFHIESGATSSEEIRNGMGNPVYPPARAELARHGISNGQVCGNNPPLNSEIDENSANIDENSAKEREASPTFKKDNIGELSGAIPGILSLLPKNLPSADPRQTALLLAIKPYLSQKRAELIDGFLKFEQIGSLLKNLNAGGNNVLQ